MSCRCRPGPRLIRVALVAGLAPWVLGLACTDDLAPDVQEVPVITVLEPEQGAVGDTVAVLGSGFGTDSGAGRLLIGGVQAEVVTWARTRIDGIVPAGAQSGPVLVELGGRSSNVLVFVVAGTGEPPPVLLELVPARTVAGDTLLITGTDFGEAPGDRTVVFTAAGDAEVAAAVLDWQDAAVRVLVPAGAVSGPVRVRAPGSASNDLAFDLAPRLISYVLEIDTFFGDPSLGCKGCHGGSGGLFVDTYESLMRGDSDHGPVIQPRRSAESILIQKLTDPPFGARMPFGGDPVPAERVQVIADWIDQGARNN